MKHKDIIRLMDQMNPMIYQQTLATLSWDFGRRYYNYMGIYAHNHFTFQENIYKVLECDFKRTREGLDHGYEGTLECLSQYLSDDETYGMLIWLAEHVSKWVHPDPMGNFSRIFCDLFLGDVFSLSRSDKINYRKPEIIGEHLSDKRAYEIGLIVSQYRAEKWKGKILAFEEDIERENNKIPRNAFVDKHDCYPIIAGIIRFRHRSLLWQRLKENIKAEEWPQMDKIAQAWLKLDRPFELHFPELNAENLDDYFALYPKIDKQLIHKFKRNDDTKASF